MGAFLLKEQKFVPVEAKTLNQAAFVESIRKNQITICTGLAGSGKTLLSLSETLNFILNTKSRYKHLTVVRPYVLQQGSEKGGIGYLPGDFNSKFLPFSEAIQDNLRLLMDESEIKKLVETKVIDYSIVSMCRGRSFHRTCVLVDEVQNCDFDSLKMLLTRIADDSKLILVGDPSQCDLPRGVSAITEVARLLDGIENIGVVTLNDYNDIQRSPLIREILKKLEGYKGVKK